VHSLNSSSRQFGALKLGNIAEEMEVLAKENNLTAAKKILNILLAIHEQVEQRIEQQSETNIEHNNNATKFDKTDS